MFDHRSIPAGHFKAGEPVWFYFDGRIQRGVVVEAPTESGEMVLVRAADREFRLWANKTEVFKRPTEYHLLRAAVDDLIDELKRDCRELLLETGR